MSVSKVLVEYSNDPPNYYYAIRRVVFLCGGKEVNIMPHWPGWRSRSWRYFWALKRAIRAWLKRFNPELHELAEFVYIYTH